MNSVVSTISSVSGGKDTIFNSVNKLTSLTENLSAACEQISSSTEEQTATILDINLLTEENRKAAKLLREEFQKFKV